MWLRVSMCRRNPSSKSASSPKVEEKTLLFFTSCSRLGKGLYRSSRHLKSISLDKDSHQALKPKIIIGAEEVTGIAYRCIEHHPFRHCRSRFFMGDNDLQCTLYSTLCSARFQCNSFENQNAKSVRYRPVLRA